VLRHNSTHPGFCQGKRIKTGGLSLELGRWKSTGAVRVRPAPAERLSSEGLAGLLVLFFSGLLGLFPGLLLSSFILVLLALISHGATPFHMVIDSSGVDVDQNQ
jgi:hypothetical protein